ncbi:MAG: ATP-binding cassette domain-containing protein [Acidimicrobiia bacterium]|nr:ATP-binding cassette domain-containing protein [Acidimicrobiia bacterium]
MSETVTLEANGLDKHFGNLHVTWYVDLAVQTGVIHALIGPNGAGKTTLLSQLSGELPPDSGTVLLDGVDITDVGLSSRVDLGICRSFQTSSPFPDFTARENVVLALLASEGRGMGLIRGGGSDQDHNRIADDLLSDVGLDVDGSTPVPELDHGAIRQLEIAMALATDPSILLLDEPMAGLAPGEVEGLADLLGHIRSDHGIILVEHDMDVVFSLADRITVLSEGAVVASGTPNEIRDDDRVQELYLREGDPQ